MRTFDLIVMAHGVLLLDKHAGISSNGALQKVRRLYAGAKAGHTGTLDPLASGLLPICLGEATKFSHALLDADKSYEANIGLGFISSTGDAEGTLQSFGTPDFSIRQLHTVLSAFTGPLDQLPPMHSALKKDGKPLYAYARAGEIVTRQLRKIVIKTLQLIDYDKNHIRIHVNCSKGTYIRVLAQDIGQALGCGGYLLSLRRTGIRELTVADSIGLEELGAMDEPRRLAQLLPVDRLVNTLPALQLSGEATRRIANGLGVAHAALGMGLVRLYDSAGTFLGVGESRTPGTLVAKRLVAQAPTARSSRFAVD